MSKKEKNFYCKLGQAVSNAFLMLALCGTFASMLVYMFIR